MSRYAVNSGPYFPVLELNTGKYGPEITPYLDIFHAVLRTKKIFLIEIKRLSFAEKKKDNGHKV